MKALVRTLVKKTLDSNLFWFYYLVGEPLFALGKIYEAGRSFRYNSRKRRHCLDKIFSDLTVKNGPFRGLRYLDGCTRGSTYFPKLLGSYEAELHPLFDGIFRNDYECIVDVGCAEGYYAVGLSQKFPRAKVFAFDSDPLAQNLCREMSQMNGIDSRLTVGAQCDGQVLRSLPLGRKSLIISDCEGYENELFSEEIVSFLAPHDVLIEVHDFFEGKIDAVLRKRFAHSHDITMIESIDDAKKVRTYRYPELEGCDLETKLFILAEYRSSTMEWLFMTPKHR